MCQQMLTSTMEQRRWKNEDCMPLTEDVVTLQNCLKNIEDESKAQLKKEVSTTSHKRLCESLLAQETGRRSIAANLKDVSKSRHWPSE